MDGKDPMDVVQKYIEANKPALSQISFGGGTFFDETRKRGHEAALRACCQGGCEKEMDELLARITGVSEVP
jgi:hypothetical protein